MCQTVLPVMICPNLASPPLSDGAADSASVPCLAPCLSPLTLAAIESIGSVLPRTSNLRNDLRSRREPILCGVSCARRPGLLTAHPRLSMRLFGMRRQTRALCRVHVSMRDARSVATRTLSVYCYRCDFR